MLSNILCMYPFSFLKSFRKSSEDESFWLEGKANHMTYINKLLTRFFWFVFFPVHRTHNALKILAYSWLSIKISWTFLTASNFFLTKTPKQPIHLFYPNPHLSRFFSRSILKHNSNKHTRCLVYAMSPILSHMGLLQALQTSRPSTNSCTCPTLSSAPALGLLVSCLNYRHRLIRIS